MENITTSSRDPKFSQASAGRNSWKDYGAKAENERAVMVAEFRVWMMKTRPEVEEKLLNMQQHLRRVDPFARVAIEKAESPAELPLVVAEFAQTALEVADVQRKFDLINVYFEQQATCYSDTDLHIEKGNEAKINALWDWFIEDRNKPVDAASTRKASAA